MHGLFVIGLFLMTIYHMYVDIYPREVMNTTCTFTRTYTLNFTEMTRSGPLIIKQHYLTIVTSNSTIFNIKRISEYDDELSKLFYVILLGNIQFVYFQCLYWELSGATIS